MKHKNKYFVAFCLLAGCCYITFLIQPVLAPSSDASKGPPSQKGLIQHRMELHRELNEKMFWAMQKGDTDELNHQWSLFQEAGFVSLNERFAMAEYFIKIKDYQSAKEHLDFILNPPPNISGTLVTSGRTLALWIEAASHLENVNIEEQIEKWARKQDQSISRPWPPLAQAYFLAGKELQSIGTPDALSKSDKYFSKALSIVPNSPELWSELGSTYSSWGKLAEAKQAYVQAYHFSPSNKQAFVKKAFQLTDRNLNGDYTDHPALRKAGKIPTVLNPSLNWDEETKQTFYSQQKMQKDSALKVYGSLPVPLRKRAQQDLLLTDEDLANAKRSGLIK